MKVARTQESPDERDGHVLFTHPRTWLRDLDPFARSKYPLTSAEQARDLHVWDARLSYAMPASQVEAAIVCAEGMFEVSRAGFYRVAGIDMEVIVDPDCPPDRMYFRQDLGAMAAKVAKFGGTPQHVYVNPTTYAKLLKQEEDRKVRERVEARLGLRGSLWKALGLGSFFAGAAA